MLCGTTFIGQAALATRNELFTQPPPPPLLATDRVLADGTLLTPLNPIPAEQYGPSFWASTCLIRRDDSIGVPVVAGGPGGLSGQIQWNKAGAFAGFTMIGDATCVPSTGVLTINPGAIGLITRAVIPAIRVTVNTFMTGGFATFGDLGAGAIYTNVGAGPASINAIQDAAGTWFALVTNQPLNVGWFGAKGDGVFDDSTAIHAAVNVAASRVPNGPTQGSVYFPKGIYRLASSGVLTSSNAASSNGVKYYGDGMDASILRLDISLASVDHYFYDNVSSAQMQQNSFVDLCFQGMNPSNLSVFSDIPLHAKGFRLNSTIATGSQEQNFHFTRCKFFALNNVFETAGDNTASENSWSQCEINQVRGSVLSINNQQSFNHEFYGTNFSNIYGNTFSVVSGGGAIKVYGGSVILSSDSGSDTYFLLGTATIGNGGLPYIFQGLRIELHGDHTKLVNLTSTEGFDLVFASCLFEDQGSGTKTAWCDVEPFSHVAFQNCTFYEIFGSTILFSVTDPNRFNQSGSIVFDGCGIGTDWSDQCSTVNYGLISARNCYGLNVGAESGGQHWAHDFDVRRDESVPGLYTGWTAGSASPGSPTDGMIRIKVAQMLSGAEKWPNSGNELQLKLPRNAIIKNIFLRKQAGTTDTTVCTLDVNRNDKSGTPHVISDSQQYKVAQTGQTLNYFYNVGTTTNERNLRLYTSAPTTEAIGGGFCIVEYV